MSEWRITKLGSVITLKRGYDLPNSKRQEGSIPVVSSSGITDYHDEYKVKAPGVVTGRYGTIGEVFYVVEDFWPLNTTLYVEDFKGNDPRFISYFLRCIDFQAYAAKSAVPGINRNDLHLADIKIPDVPTQKQIASILSKYDDLIENNNRRIAILEELAQKLYREWFVHFRFPGHENVKMVESEMGLIPADWHRYCFSDIARFIKGKKPSDITNEQQVGYVKNILLDAIASGEYKFVSPQKMVLVEPNDIFMVMDGASSGKVFSGECGAVGSTLAKVSTPDEYRFILLMYLANHESSIMDNNTGSAIPHANKDFVNMMRLTIPNDGLLERFNSIIGKYMRQKQLLRDKNLNLRKTRDLLLPRLISGDIDVSKLDIPIKED